MICDFNSICPDSKLWIFSSKRQLSLHEQSKIKNLLSIFLTNWESHNNSDTNTLFFDTTIKKKKELDSWLIPIKDGWCNAFLK